MFRCSTKLAKVSQTKKTIAVLNQLSGRCGYSYIRTIVFLVWASKVRTQGVRNVHPCVARHPVARHRDQFSTQQYQILARSTSILGIKSVSYPLQLHIIWSWCTLCSACSTTLHLRCSLTFVTLLILYSC